MEEIYLYISNKSMKKFSLLGLGLLGAITLAACNNSTISVNSGDSLKNTALYVAQVDGSSQLGAYINLLFKGSSKVPYISVNDMVEMINSLRESSLSQDYHINYEIKDNVITLKNEKNATAVIDATKQTISFDDFTTYAANTKIGESTMPAFHLNDMKSIKSLGYKVTKGSAKTIDLSGYSALDIYKSGDRYYIPVTVYNQIFLNTLDSYNFVYNQSDLFMFSLDMLETVDTLGNTVYTEFGKKYYGGEKLSTVDSTYSNYFYQSLLLDFDNMYGLKSDKFESFDTYLTQKGYKEDLLSGDVKRMDSALVYALTYLNDNHTALTNLSTFYNEYENTVDMTKANPAFVQLSDDRKALKETRNTAKVSTGTQVIDDAFYIGFDNFTEINEKLLYNSDLTNYNSTAVLFADSYKQLNNQYKDKVKYVVIDLSLNGGGNIDGLLYALSTVIGDVKFNLKNSFDGTTSTETYKADLNLDGKVDENDKSLVDLGYKVIFLNSSHTFSSANALTCIAKNLQPNKVYTAGETSGGGPCVVRMAVTALGSVLSTSGINCMCVADANNNLTHIDAGVKADIAVARANFYDREELTKTIKANFEK